MTKFTPEPWEWVEYEYGYASLWNPETKEEIITLGGKNDGDYPLVWMGEDLKEADKLIIANSPSMYEALSTCPIPPNVDSFTYRHAMEEWLKVADAWYRDMQRTLGNIMVE